MSYQYPDPPPRRAFVPKSRGWSLDQNDNDAGSHHSERTRRSEGYIDNAASHEGSAIIDAAVDRMTGIGHGDDASERARSMRAGHLTFVASAAIVWRVAAFGLCRLGQGNQRDCNERIPVQWRHSLPASMWEIVRSVWLRDAILPMTSTAAPISATAKQQHQKNNDENQFHSKSPLRSRLQMEGTDRYELSSAPLEFRCRPSWRRRMKKAASWSGLAFPLLIRVLSGLRDPENGRREVRRRGGFAAGVKWVHGRHIRWHSRGRTGQGSQATHQTLQYHRRFCAPQHGNVGRVNFVPKGDPRRPTSARHQSARSDGSRGRSRSANRAAPCPHREAGDGRHERSSDHR